MNKRHKCSKDDCEALTTALYCRKHCYKYTACKYENCERNARGDFCHLHNPEYMENKRQKARDHKYAKKMMAAC